MLWLASVAVLVSTVSGADVRVDSLPALKAAAEAAGPGDRIVLAPGVYTGTLTLTGVRGEKDRPVVIAGADATTPPTIRGGSECIHVSKAAYLTLENFALERATGNGLNIDDGGDRSTLAPGITLRKVQVRDIGAGCGEGRAGTGNCDAVKLSGLTGFRIEACTIERWGTGGSGIDMVGCHDGLVTDCVFRHDAPGSKDQQGASGVQFKGGSKGVTVRSCRFEHAGQRGVNIGGSTGLEFFRPPLKSEATENAEAAGVVVEGCTFFGGDAAVAFVGCDGAEVRFNTIYHPRRWALRVLQENRAAGFVPCRGGSFTDNIVVLGDGVPGRSAAAVNVGDGTKAAEFVFARNAWFSNDRSKRPPSTLPAPEKDGMYGVDPRLRDPAKGDFTPGEGNPCAKAGARALPAPAKSDPKK
jgi:hypothetical protein